jgi:hypothetical protein
MPELLNLNIDWNGETFIVVVEKRRKADYFSLVSGLMKTMGYAKIQNLKKDNVIKFEDIIHSFKPVGRFCCEEADEQCICGYQPIREICYVKNKETGEDHIIGSTCIGHWEDYDEEFKSKRTRERKERKAEKDKKEIVLCCFCDRNITKTKQHKCKNDKLKEKAKRVIDKWETLMVHKEILARKVIRKIRELVRKRRFEKRENSFPFLRMCSSIKCLSDEESEEDEESDEEEEILIKPIKEYFQITKMPPDVCKYCHEPLITENQKKYKSHFTCKYPQNETETYVLCNMCQIKRHSIRFKQCYTCNN